jgi:hypothetical protein
MNMDETLLKGGLTAKGYKTDVVNALVPYGQKQLLEMDSIDDQTMGANKANPLNKPPQEMQSYLKADGALRSMARQNVVFASTLAEKYKADPKGYTSFMRGFADDMYANPALADKVADLAQKGDAGKLLKLQSDYAANPSRTINALSQPAGPAPSPKGPSVDAAAVVNVAATGHETKAAKTTPSNREHDAGFQHKAAKAAKGTQRDANLERIRQQAAATAPAAAGAGAAAIVASGSSEPLDKVTEAEHPTAEEASKEFSAYLKENPKGKFATALSKQEGLEKEIQDKLKQDPELVKAIRSPGTLAKLTDKLEKGDRTGFMNDFSGPKADGSITGAMGLGGLGDMFSKFFGGSGGTGGAGGGFGQQFPVLNQMFSGVMDSVKGFFGKFFGAGGFIERIGASLQGPGTNVTKLLSKNPDMANNAASNNMALALDQRAEVVADAQRLQDMNPAEWKRQYGQDSAGRPGPLREKLLEAEGTLKKSGVSPDDIKYRLRYSEYTDGQGIVHSERGRVTHVPVTTEKYKEKVLDAEGRETIVEKERKIAGVPVISNTGLDVTKRVAVANPAIEQSQPQPAPAVEVRPVSPIPKLETRPLEPQAPRPTNEEPVVVGGP